MRSADSPQSQLAIGSAQQGQRTLQKCWGSAQCWRTSISATMGSAMLGQGVLQECWRSAQRSLTSISSTMESAQQGQRVRSAAAVHSNGSAQSRLE